MGSQVAGPLSLAEAKERVREAAARASLTEWTKEHPIEGVLSAFLTGLTVGGNPESIREARNVALSLMQFFAR